MRVFLTIYVCLFLAACSSSCSSDSEDNTSSTPISNENSSQAGQSENEQGPDDQQDPESEDGQAPEDPQDPENQNSEPQDEGNPADPAIIPLTESQWDTSEYGYDGYGSIIFVSDGIILSPAAPVSAAEVLANPDDTTLATTHAALILAKTTQQNPVKDFILTVTLITQTQLRTDYPPNPWEVAWIFFNYLPVGGNKETNYFVFKTNGIELGKAFGSSGQDFLLTEGTPQLSLNTPYTITITKNGQDLTVKINAETVLSGSAWTGPLYDVPGWIGIYTEDATIKVLSVSLVSI